MSRVGQQPIVLPKGVKVSPGEGVVQVEGPKGKLSLPLPRGIHCQINGDSVQVNRSSDSKKQRAFHGLARSLLANAVKGATDGFSRHLQIEGVGYRAQVQGRELNLTLGLSHPVVYKIPSGVTIKVDNQVKISVSGVDRQQVGQVAAEIRSLRPPEPYKGKGIRYVNEYIKRKVGKTGA